MAVGATAIVLAVVAGVVTARALGPWGSGRGPAASAAARPAASSSAASAGAGEAASPAAQSTPKPTFVVSRALSDVRALEDIGMRSAGGGGEKRGAALIAGRLVAA